jgi:hypothetical protein
MGRAVATYMRPNMPPWLAAWLCPPLGLPSLSINHGVTITATKKEKIIAAEALAGMGLM